MGRLGFLLSPSLSLSCVPFSLSVSWAWRINFRFVFLQTVRNVQKCWTHANYPAPKVSRCQNEASATRAKVHDEEGCHACSARPPSLITWMPARLPGTSLKCANAKRHLHLHTKCKRNSTRALTTECGGTGSRGRNWGQALCQLVGVELCGGRGWWGSWSSYLGALMWATRIQIQIQHYLPPPPHSSSRCPCLSCASTYCCCSCAFAHFIIFYDFWQRCEKACVTSGQPHVYPIKCVSARK